MKTHASWTLSGAMLALLVVGCDRRNAACTELLTSDESSSGIFSYTAPDGGSPAHMPLSGSVGPASELTVTGVGGPQVSYSGCPSGNTDDNTIIINGQLVDATGTPQPFCLQVNGVTEGSSASLGSGSVACFENLEACTPLTGTIDTTTFVTSCVSAPDTENTLCALEIAGTLKASTTWSDGSFAVDLALEHRDSCD
jgi:hypothetical protein